mmetsp:Transcript_62443/g.112020  ORF Transcript_62443/g.112020 Transcript_62443/m.112020 type:complete len:89 (-) Transcript_62443:327-593(-)
MIPTLVLLCVAALGSKEACEAEPMAMIQLPQKENDTAKLCKTWDFRCRETLNVEACVEYARHCGASDSLEGPADGWTTSELPQAKPHI